MTGQEHPDEEFVSERMMPVRASADAKGPARGEPGLPAQFVWRDETHTVAEVLRKWKTSAPERHTHGELYLRRHWWTLRTTLGLVVTLYCLRRAKPGEGRWWVYTIRR